MSWVMAELMAEMATRMSSTRLASSPAQTGLKRNHFKD